MNDIVKYRHVMVLTGEPSGDVHASKLVRQIRELRPDVRFSGIGGPALERENVRLFYHIKDLSVMGGTEVLARIGKIFQAFLQLKKQLRQDRPDLVILVDYPGFNLRAAQYIKRHYAIPILYYIAPKVWAWNRSRLKRIRQYTDHVALILPFESVLYDRAGIAATYVGNPLVDDYPDFAVQPLVNKKPDHSIIIGLLPGSRKTEINQLLPVMIQASRVLAGKIKNVCFVVSKAESIDAGLIREHINAAGLTPDHTRSDINMAIEPRSVRRIFEKADLLIAASGTVTLEAALAGVPAVLIYKMSPLSFMAAKWLVQVKYAGLANLIVQKEVMPELLQDQADADTISRTVLSMLSRLTFHQKETALVRRFLGAPGASRRAAAIAVQLMRPE